MRVFITMVQNSDNLTFFLKETRRNPPLGSVEIVKSALVLLQRGASRVVILVAVVRLPLPLARLRSH